MSGMFPAIGAALFGGGAAAGAAAGTAAATTAASTAAAGTAAASTAAAGAGSLATISNVLSAGSALMAIGQGISANATAKTQAAFANAQSFQEKAAGASQAASLAKEYAALRSEQQVAQLANGLNIGVGTPVDIGQATQRQADREIATTRQTASNRASMARLRARGLMSEGRAALMGGFGQAAQIGLKAYQLTG